VGASRARHAIQLVYEVVLHQRPDPTWADAAYLAFYPVACAGFFAYPIGDLLLLFGVLSLLRIFATGMLMFIAADVTYDYSTIHAAYNGGDPVDTLWMLALTILWVAAGWVIPISVNVGPDSVTDPGFRPSSPSSCAPSRCPARCSPWR